MAMPVGEKSIAFALCADTIVHIGTANQEQEARYNTLETWAQWYPNIKPLVQLRAIELRLTKLVDELRTGPR